MSETQRQDKAQSVSPLEMLDMMIKIMDGRSNREIFLPPFNTSEQVVSVAKYVLNKYTKLPDQGNKGYTYHEDEFPSGLREPSPINFIHRRFTPDPIDMVHVNSYANPAYTPTMNIATTQAVTQGIGDVPRFWEGVNNIVNTPPSNPANLPEYNRRTGSNTSYVDVILGSQ